MSSLPTRRAQEYFETLDELHAEGYVTHEEWMTTPVKERESIAKMTNQIIQDALVEKGYSRGSPNELLKYRTKWLQSRGLLESQGEHKDKPTSDDPIYQMVESVRQKLEKEADEKVEYAKQTADKKVSEMSERHEELKKELFLTRKTLDALQADHRDMKEENRVLISNIKEAEKRNIALETQLNELNKSSTELLEKEQQHREDMMQKNSTTIKRLEEDLKQNREDYKTQLSDLKQQSEDQRHQLIVEVRNYKDKSEKLDKQLHQLQLSEQRLKDQLDSLNKQTEQLKTTYDMLNQDFKEKSKAFLEGEKERAILKTKISEYEHRINDEKEQKENKQKALLQAKEQLGKLEAMLDDKKHQLERLQEELRKTTKSEKKR